MITTWTLWRALNHPPARYPLFWRPIKTRPDPRYSRVNWRLLSSWLMIFGVCLLCASGGAPFGLQLPLYFLAMILFFTPVLFLLRFTVLDGMYHGLLWSLSMTRTLIREREHQTYELLCLLPGGALVAAWALCTGILYYDRGLRQASGRHQVMVILFAVATGLGSLAAIATPTVALWYAYTMGLLTLWLCLEYAQSVVLGVVIALLMPTFTSNRFEAGVMSSALFLLAQVASGAISLAVAFSIRTGGWEIEVIRPLVSVLLFFGLREAMIAAGWWLLLRRLSVTPSEQAAFF
jgi:hypothetical protein